MTSRIYILWAGAALFLVPDLIRWEALLKGRAAWGLMSLGLLGLLVPALGPSPSQGLPDPWVWLSLLGILVGTLSWIRQKDHRSELPLEEGSAQAAPGKNPSFEGAEAWGFRLPERLSWILVIALWISALGLLAAKAHMGGFLVASSLALGFLGRHGRRKAALGLLLAFVLGAAGLALAQPKLLERFLAFYTDASASGPGWFVKLSQEAILNAWPVGRSPLGNLQPIPAEFSRDYVLALVADRAGWPGLLGVLAGYGLFFTGLFRAAARLRQAWTGDVLWAFGSLLLIVLLDSLSHILKLHPWPMPLPLLSPDPVLAGLMLVAAGMWMKVASGRRPC